MAKARSEVMIANPSRRAALKAGTALLALAGMRGLHAAPATIRINIPGPLLMPFFPVELIPKLGIDAQLGTHLGIRYHISGVLALEDMLAGNAEFAGAGFPILPKFLEKNHQLVAIARLSSGAPPYAIVVRADLAGTIRTIADLRGRTLGVHVGSPTTKTYLQLVAEQWVSAHGVRPEQVRWAPVAQNYEGVYGAMAGETVDAVFCEEPYSASLVRAGLGRVLASLNDSRQSGLIAGRNHLRAVIVTTPEHIRANPQRVQTLTRMLRRALQWTSAATPAEIVARLAIADAGQRADIVDALKRLPAQYSPDGGFSDTEIEATREFMRAVGIALPAGTDIRDLIDDRWIRLD